MSNLLMIWSKREPTNIMCENFWRIITKRGDTDIAFRCVPSTEVTTEDIEWSDIVHAVRPQGQMAAQIVKMAHKIGKLTFTFLDDDLLAINTIYEKEMHGVRAVKLALKYTDVVVSPSRILLKKLLKFIDGERAILTYMGVDESEIIRNEIQDKEIVNILFFASYKKSEAFQNTVAKAMNRLYERFGDRLFWTFINVQPDDWEDTPYRDKSAYIPPMPLKDFRKELAGGTL